jgi:hypothetical protein
MKAKKFNYRAVILVFLAVAVFLALFALNQKESLGTIKNLYKATGVPESFIINKQGILIKKIIGPLDWATPEAVRFFRDLI